jgi:uncharacterized protein DUF6111
MIRIVAENIVLFLLPTIVYIAFIYLTREDKPGASSILNDAPLIWLFVAGAILVVVTLATFGSVTGGKPGQVYTPPALKDGRIEPGHLD